MIDLEQQQFLEVYPWNLLFAIKGETGIQLPKRLTMDVAAGLGYALSTLDEGAQAVLCKHYRQKLPLEEIANALPASLEEVRQIQRSALKSLGRPCRWNYIRYGIVGYTSEHSQKEYNRGYNLGYDTGYRNGVNDARNRTARFYGNENVLLLPIYNMNLSTRTFDCLKRAGYERIYDIVGLSASQILQIRGMGKISANEVALAIQSYGIEHTAWDAFAL